MRRSAAGFSGGRTRPRREPARISRAAPLRTHTYGSNLPNSGWRSFFSAIRALAVALMRTCVRGASTSRPVSTVTPSVKSNFPATNVTLAPPVFSTDRLRASGSGLSPTQSHVGLSPSMCSGP